MQLDRQQLSVLAKKLASVDCTAGFDETVLMYPETEAWSAIIGQLCDKLRCGHTVDKLVKEEGREGDPLTQLERTQQLLDVLCIEATDEQILGSGSPQDRIDFLEHLTDIAISVSASCRGERLKEASSKDAMLLGTACKAAADLTITDVNLFKRFPEVHAIVQAAAREAEKADDTPLHQRLEKAQHALKNTETMLGGLEGQTDVLTLEGMQSTCARLERSLGAFVAGAAEFNALYTKDIEAWTATVSAPPLLGIGPLAKAVDLQYADFQKVLQACSMLKASYEQLLQRHEGSTSEDSFMPHILSQGPALAEEFQARTVALQAICSTANQPLPLSTEGL